MIARSFLHSAFCMGISQCTSLSVLCVDVLQLSKRIFEGFELVLRRNLFLLIPLVYSHLPIDSGQNWTADTILIFAKVFPISLEISGLPLRFKLLLPQWETKRAICSRRKIIYPVWKWKRSQWRHLCPSVFGLIAMKLWGVSCLSLSHLSCCFILSFS